MTQPGCKKNKIFNAKGEKITIFARKYSKNNFGNIDIPGNARVIYQAQWMNECKVYGTKIRKVLLTTLKDSSGERQTSLSTLEIS